MPFRSRTRLFAALAGLVTACAVGVIAQPPTEVEDPKGGLKKRIKVEDDPAPARKDGDSGPGTPPDVRLDELVRGAEETTNGTLKDLFTRHAIPFDRLTTKVGTQRIRPIPVARGERLPPQFGIQELGRDGQFGETEGVNAVDVRKIEYFEEVALTEANQVLGAKPFGTGAGAGTWSAAEQLGAAERLMSAALRYHDYARERNIRKGRGWDELRKPLADRLREVRLLNLKHAVTTADWSRGDTAGTKLMLAYPGDSGVAAEVAAARVLQAKRLLATEEHSAHVRARKLLDEFEANYPGGGGEPVRAIRAELTQRAQQALTVAKQKHVANDAKAAGEALRTAVALDPTLPEVRDLQRELKTGYQTLYVGVRQYPEQMSPITAKLDSEKQAVELLFEGLLAEVPDDGGGPRFRPACATAMPAVVPGGREFGLRTFDRDATNRFGFASHDVVGTLKLLNTQPQTWTAYALPWIEDVTPKDNTALRVAFRQGHPDPRALLTFKLLPARWMANTGRAVDDAGFAEKPAGTGPYRLHANPRPTPNAPREMVFLDNPLYGRWPDRADQPLIKEIRLVEASKVHNVIESFQQGSLHVLPDVATADIEKYRGALAGKADVHTATNNRRVHMLAVNHRRPALQNTILRQGLSFAIDRDKILNEVYRAGKAEFHRALTGPFPPGSWASAKGAPLVNSDLALTRIRTYLLDQGVKGEVALLYPSDDEQAKRACEKIKEQVEGLFKEQPGRKLTVTLEAQPLRTVLQRVEDEHRYDLAYVPFDYPDDWHPFALGAMLDPQAAERGGRNWFGFNRKGGTGSTDTDTRLGAMLNELRAFREFSALATKSAEVQKAFNECVPFIPLWQLDRHTLVHNDLTVFTDESDKPADPRVLDPTTLFQGVARWQLK